MPTSDHGPVPDMEIEYDPTMQSGQPVEALELLPDDMPDGPLPCDVEIQAWHIQPGETTTNYGLFRIYCYMASLRTLRRVSRKTGLSYIHILDVARENKWRERSAAYDTYWIRRQDEAKRRAQDLQAAKWAKRAESQKEWEWTISTRLRTQIEAMLDWPLFVETLESTNQELTTDGIIVKNIIRQEPADWNLSDMARFMVIQSKFARMSTGQDNTRLRSNVDVTKLSDAELEALTNET